MARTRLARTKKKKTKTRRRAAFRPLLGGGACKTSDDCDPLETCIKGECVWAIPTSAPGTGWAVPGATRYMRGTPYASKQPMVAAQRAFSYTRGLTRSEPLAGPAEVEAFYRGYNAHEGVGRRSPEMGGIGRGAEPIGRDYGAVAFPRFRAWGIPMHSRRKAKKMFLKARPMRPVPVSGCWVERDPPEYDNWGKKIKDYISPCPDDAGTI